MASREYEHLTTEQVSSFKQNGYLRVKNCFPRAVAEEWTKDVWTRLGMNPNDPNTWTAERTNMPAHNKVKISDFAPRAWQAICQVIGGEDRMTEDSKCWSDNFIVNLGTKEHEGKEAHPKELQGWHVDGDFFVHFLDSPEQGLLVIPLFTDILPNGGGTWICSEGPPRIGRWLHDHPEGVTPYMESVNDPTPRKSSSEPSRLSFFNSTVQACPDSSFFEMTGEVGDVILLHPLMLHSASRNGRRLPRIITNPPVHLKEPFNFNRANPQDYSLVELKTMNDLGVDSLPDWKITGPRQAVIPDRLKRQAEMLKDEQARMQQIIPPSKPTQAIATAS